MPFTSSKRSTRRAGRRQRGAAVVEFAMVLVPLLLILLGTIDWGCYLYFRAIVTDAARAGARAGSLDPAHAQATAENTATTFLANLRITGETFPAYTGAVPPSSVCIRIELTTPSLTGFTGLFPDMLMLPTNASAQACMRLEP
jgi:Flp pilus assembly protein TadG